jgi:hypothetical protein
MLLLLAERRLADRRGKFCRQADASGMIGLVASLAQII